MYVLSSRVLKRVSVTLWVCLILKICFLPYSVLGKTTQDTLSWVLVIVAWWLYRLGNSRLPDERRFKAAKDELNLHQVFSERIILYLRSFEDDEKLATFPLNDKALEEDERDFLNDSFSSFKFSPPAYTEEEQLKAVMGESGHFITIRRPNEDFPHSGASRLRVGHEWQEQVRKLMVKSLFVVIRLGTTEGLLWELQTAVEHLEPGRLLLLVPYDEIEYNNFCKQHQDLFPKSLPSYDEGETVGTLRGIICFQEDWTPEFLTLERITLFWPGESLQSSLKVALLPFIDRLNVPYQPLRLSREAIFRWFLFGSGTCGFLFALISNFSNMPVWALLMAGPASLIFIAFIWAEMYVFYSLRSRFPGRY